MTVSTKTKLLDKLAEMCELFKECITDETLKAEMASEIFNEKEYGTDENVILSYTGSNHYIIQSDKQQMEIYVIME